MKKYNLVFFGSPHNSARLLKKLDKDKHFHITAVVTQPDRPAGRGQKTLSTPVAQYSRQNKIPVFKPRRHSRKKHLLKNPSRLEKKLQPLNFHLLLVYEFGQLIPQEIIRLAKYGGINIHFSLLPAYRGASPLPWQILKNEKETGISFVSLDPKFDQGKIIFQKVYPISNQETTKDLHKKLSRQTLQITPQLLLDYLSGKLQTKKIASAQSTSSSYYPRLSRRDGFVPWPDLAAACQLNNRQKPAKKLASQIERKIRAFAPWPGVWTTIEDKRLKILSSEVKEGKLIPQEVQLTGEKSTAWSSFKKRLAN